MRLLKVHFEKYKSITGDELDIDSFTTCLVGINESGKSNVLLALQKINSTEKLTTSELSRYSDDYGDNSKSPIIKIWLRPKTKEEAKQLEIIFGKPVDLLVLTKEFDTYQIDYPSIDFKKSSFYVKPVTQIVENNKSDGQDTPPVPQAEPEKIEVKQDDIEKDIRQKVVNEIKSKYIPLFSRFDSVNFDDFYLPLNGEVDISKLISEPDKFVPVINLLLLGNITNLEILKASNETERIRRDTQLRKASDLINKEVTHVVWPIDSVSIQLEADGNLLKIRLKEGTNLPFSPQERSRGLQWTLAFNIYFLASAKKELSNSILLIDEPGIFLHINAQKKLLEETFKKITENHIQIIYTTHLPYLIHPSFPERIRILDRDKECTIIGNQAWSEENYGLIPEPVKTALGLQWSHIFNFLDKNLVVEGPSDQMMIRALYEKLGYKLDFAIVPSYGYEKEPSVLALISIENKLGFGIVDSDSDMDLLHDKCKKINLPINSIANLSSITKNQKIITTEDIIPESVYKEAIYSVYYNRVKFMNKEIILKDIPVSYPRIKNTEEYIASLFGAENHILRKIDIAKEVVRILQEKKLDTSNSEWSEAKKVCKAIFSKLSNKKVSSTQTL